MSAGDHYPDPDAIFSGLVAADAAVTGMQRDSKAASGAAGMNGNEWLAGAGGECW